MTENTTPSLSFEFFPPANEAQAARFESARTRLLALQPEYLSVTFGAGGSTRSRTRQTVFDCQANSPVPVAPHLSCMAESIGDIESLLQEYRDKGINRLVVLRGDRPSGGMAGVFRYAAELVSFIREHHGDHFHIEVAAYPEHHPESASPDKDVAHFAAKVKAGANGAITQYFFSAESYFRFVDEAQRLGVSVPITPGIMPITSYPGLARFSAMCGAEIPQWIAKRLAAWDQADDQSSLQAFGEEVVTALCQRLLEGGAPGLHLYTLNRASASLAICRNLGFSAG